MNVKHQKIVFFDGVCNLCNSTVDFLIRRDKKHILKFASLQSGLAQSILPEDAAFKADDLNTIIYYRQGKVYFRSSAVIKIVSDLGGIYTLTGIFFIIPSFIRNNVYNWIAQNRYRWFGKKDRCRLPEPEERSQFL